MWLHSETASRGKESVERCDERQCQSPLAREASHRVDAIATGRGPRLSPRFSVVAPARSVRTMACVGDVCGAFGRAMCGGRANRLKRLLALLLHALWRMCDDSADRAGSHRATSSRDERADLETQRGRHRARVSALFLCRRGGDPALQPFPLPFPLRRCVPVSSRPRARSCWWRSGVGGGSRGVRPCDMGMGMGEPSPRNKERAEPARPTVHRSSAEQRAED